MQNRQATLLCKVLIVTCITTVPPYSTSLKGPSPFLVLAATRILYSVFISRSVRVMRLSHVMISFVRVVPFSSVVSTKIL